MTEISDKLDKLISVTSVASQSGSKNTTINNKDSTVFAGGLKARTSDSTFQRYLDRRPVFA